MMTGTLEHFFVHYLLSVGFFCSQLFDRTSSPSPMPPPPPPPADFDMNWQTSLSQSEPSIQSRPTRPNANAYHSSSYKVSIGHETVNITEIARDRKSSDPLINMGKRRLLNSRKGASILSLCFMCFVSASMILIAISTMNLILKLNHSRNNNLLPHLIPTTNLTSNLLYMLSISETVTNLLLPTYERIIREIATVICLLIIVLNCFCLLIFSIEIYLGCNMIKNPSDTPNFRYLFSSTTSRFIAICSFYASIPALMLGKFKSLISRFLFILILVMCLFILLNLSLMPAIISLIILGFGLVFILLTLLTYFSVWQGNQLGGLNASIYHTVDATHVYDEEIDLTKTDELSTLV